MNDWSRKCWLCGRNGAADPLDEHHIFEGWGNRGISTRYDVTVPLCHSRCHIFGKEAAHNCRETAEKLHRYGQRRVMLEQGWNVEEFRLHFGRNWLDDEEIEEIYAIQRGETEDVTEGGYEAVDDIEWPEWLCA